MQILQDTKYKTVIIIPQIFLFISFIVAIFLLCWCHVVCFCHSCIHHPHVIHHEILPQDRVTRCFVSVISGMTAITRCEGDKLSTRLMFIKHIKPRTLEIHTLVQPSKRSSFAKYERSGFMKSRLSVNWPANFPCWFVLSLMQRHITNK